jgi:multidrug efflux pump subunit AcrB
MIVSDAAVKNRTSVVVLALIILVVGAYCYKVLPRESSPDITIPHVFVSTSYKGVSAADIETAITIHIEKKLKGLDRVKRIHSVSAEGLSQIDVEFIPGTDIDEVLPKVKDKVDEAMGDLPTDLENDPSVFEVNFSELPIAVFSLSGTCGNPCLKKIADDLADDIEGIPGVLEAEVTGGLEREIRIEVDPDKLTYYRIPITQLQNVISSENQNTSGGAITLGAGRFQLRVPGEFATPDDIYGLVVSTFDGRPVYLKDVATVVDGFKEESSRARLDGREAVSISVKKRVGENIIFISDKVDELIERLSTAWPPGTQITKLMDQAKDIRNLVADLENNIISGLILVAAVLLFALGMRNAILVAMAIPFSMLLSFIVLYALGITLNMVVLFSLTLALGMLVDNAIVIVENVYRYMEQGVPRIEAAMRATGEVAWPVIGSTMTTLAAFFPLIFWPGIMGEFMSYLPITLIITLASSLFVAMVINPALTAIFMKIKSNGPTTAGDAVDGDAISQSGEKPAEIKGWLLTSYTRFLRVVLQHRVVTMLIAFAMLIILFQAWLLSVGLRKPVEFFPSIDPNSIYVNIDPPEGADLAYLDGLVKKVEMAVLGADGSRVGVPDDESYLRAYHPQTHERADGTTFQGPGDIDNAEHIYAKAVRASGAESAFTANAPNNVAVQFIDLQERKHPVTQDMEQIRQRVQRIAGAKITVDQQEEGPPTGAPINIEISGDDFKILGQLAQQVGEIAAQVPHVHDVRNDFVAGLPAIRVHVDRQKAALYGLTTNAIGFALKTAYNGLDVSTYRESDEDYDITVQMPEKERVSLEALRRIMIPAPSGRLIPLTTIATIESTGTLGDITRINHQRTVTVKANVDERYVPGPVARAQAEQFLAELPIPPGYQIKFTGEFEFQQEAQAFLSRAFLVAVLLMFLILVSLFNSISQPLIILTSVVLSFGGVFLGLTLFGSPFGIIMSGVGVISLAGVVVNNAIVLIDYTNKLRARGFGLHDAVISAGATRLRPVMLTAITTVLGLVPMVTGVSYDFHVMAISWVSESTQWWRSMAIVVIFGLMVATFLTLVVVPTLYSLLASSARTLKRMKEAIQRAYWWPYYRWIERSPRHAK